MELHTNKDTQADNVLTNGHGNRDLDNEQDSADKEVAELLNLSLKLRQENSLPCDSVRFNRPSAPFPRSECFIKLERDSGCDCMTKTKDQHSCAIAFPHCKHTRSLDTCEPCKMCYFRPINNIWSSKEASQAPSKGTDVIRTSVTTASRSVQCQFQKDNLVHRHRSLYSTSSDPLPDVVPGHTERPASLPDIATLRQRCENETGRELRRIGDEFEALFKERNTRKVQTISWSLFNCSLSFHLSGYFHTIRRFLSPRPHETAEIR